MTPRLEQLPADWPNPRIPEARYIDWLIGALAQEEATDHHAEAVTKAAFRFS